MRVTRDIADIGEDQHRQMLIEEMAYSFGGRLALREPHVGERAERTADIVARRQKRLRGVGSRAGHDADRAAPPALVEKLHGASGALAGNFDTRDVVADFDRQIELRLGLAIARREREGRFAERQPFQIQRPQRSGFGGADTRAQDFHTEPAGRILGVGQRARAGDAAGNDGHRSRIDQRRQALGEIAAVAEIDAIGEPDQFDIAGRVEEARDGRHRVRAVDRMRLRLDELQAHPRGSRRGKRNIARALGQGDERHRPAVAFGTGDNVIGGAQPRVPGGRGGPAVVDQDRDRRA